MYIEGDCVLDCVGGVKPCPFFLGPFLLYLPLRPVFSYWFLAQCDLANGERAIKIYPMIVLLYSFLSSHSLVLFLLMLALGLGVWYTRPSLPYFLSPLFLKLSKFLYSLCFWTRTWPLFSSGCMWPSLLRVLVCCFLPGPTAVLPVAVASLGPCQALSRLLALLMPCVAGEPEGLEWIHGLQFLIPSQAVPQPRPCTLSFFAALPELFPGHCWILPWPLWSPNFLVVTNHILLYWAQTDWMWFLGHHFPHFLSSLCLH